VKLQALSLGGTNLFWINLDSSYQAASLPVKKPNTALALNTKQNATSQTFRLETNIKSPSFLHKVLEDLDTCSRFSDGVVVAVIF